MPLYEMILVTRMGESHLLASCLKQISAAVLNNGGIVRSLDNLGDRVLPKNVPAKDGSRHSIGRFIKVEFDASPHIKGIVETETRNNDQVLRVNTNKMKESQYLDRAMKRLNGELSPFKDKSSLDEDYIRAMWTRYSKLQTLRRGSSIKEVEKDLPRVAAFVKGLESGQENSDYQTLQAVADGELDFTDKKVQDYYISRL